jgi:hypothetical protein
MIYRPAEIHARLDNIITEAVFADQAAVCGTTESRKSAFICLILYCLLMYCKIHFRTNSRTQQQRNTRE